MSNSPVRYSPVSNCPTSVISYYDNYVTDDAMTDYIIINKLMDGQYSCSASSFQLLREHTMNIRSLVVPIPGEQLNGQAYYKPIV